MRLGACRLGLWRKLEQLGIPQQMQQLGEGVQWLRWLGHLCRAGSQPGVGNMWAPRMSCQATCTSHPLLSTTPPLFLPSPYSRPVPSTPSYPPTCIHTVASASSR